MTDWTPAFKPGDVIKTRYNTLTILNVFSDFIYSVEISGEHGTHFARFTEDCLKDIQEDNE